MPNGIAINLVRHPAGVVFRVEIAGDVDSTTLRRGTNPWLSARVDIWTLYTAALRPAQTVQTRIRLDCGGVVLQSNKCESQHICLTHRRDLSTWPPYHNEATVAKLIHIGRPYSGTRVNPTGQIWKRIDAGMERPGLPVWSKASLYVNEIAIDIGIRTEYVPAIACLYDRGVWKVDATHDRRYIGASFEVCWEGMSNASRDENISQKRRR